MSELETYNDLLTQKRAFANLATLMPDGTPQVTPVWFEFTGGKILINTARGRVKDRNLKPGAAVALSILDPDNPYRYVQIRGQVTKETEEGAKAHIDHVAQKYTGDVYKLSRPGEVRVIYEVTPRSVHGNG